MKYLDNPIEFLKTNNTITNKLKKNNIIFVKDLWYLKRKDLKSLNFTDTEINEIIIKMQLNGIDLNKYIKR